MTSKSKSVYPQIPNRAAVAFSSVATGALSPPRFWVRSVPYSYLQHQCTVYNRHSASVECIIFLYMLASSLVLAFSCSLFSAQVLCILSVYQRSLGSLLFLLSLTGYLDLVRELLQQPHNYALCLQLLSCPIHHSGCWIIE